MTNPLAMFSTCHCVYTIHIVYTCMWNTKKILNSLAEVFYSSGFQNGGTCEQGSPARQVFGFFSCQDSSIEEKKLRLEINSCVMNEKDMK